MALVDLTEEQVKKAFDDANADIKFLFDKENVDKIVQARMYDAGCLSVKQFAVMFKDIEDLRDSAKEALGIDPAKGLKEKAKLSNLLVAFDAAKKRSDKQAQLDGEATVRQQPKALPVNDFRGMREAFQTKFWMLDETRVPSQGFLEKKLDMVEKHDLKAEKLCDVTTVSEDDGGDILQTVWDPSGGLSAVKKSAKAPMPSDPETLRFRINLLGTAWCFIGFQQTNQKYLQGLHPQVFQEYLDYLLGPNVLGLVARSADGSVLSGPAWPAVLAYEQEIRVQTYRLIHLGDTLADALRKAWQDPVVKERSFTTPLAFAMVDSSRKRSADTAFPPPPPGNWTRPEPKGKGKGKDKGKGKGKTEAPSGCKSTSLDGRPICFAFNNKASKCGLGKKVPLRPRLWEMWEGEEADV